MRHLMPLLAAAASVLSTAAAYADLGDQLAKLLPDDGAFNNEFGYSVAISGATDIVGARGNDDNGPGRALSRQSMRLQRRPRLRPGRVTADRLWVI